MVGVLNLIPKCPEVSAINKMHTRWPPSDSFNSFTINSQ